MKITNFNKIPVPIYRAIKHNWYSGSNEIHFASATELLKPPKMFVLEKRYAKNLREEASNRIWSLLGSAMHKVLEQSETKNSLNEERLSCEINGKIISGGIDLYEDGVISDFKFTSVWNFVFSKRKEWEEQLNLYSYLYQKAGFEVDKLQIIAIFRDWSASKAKFEKHYPKQVEIISLKKWDISWCHHFIADKLCKLEMALKTPDDQIAPCNLEQRWQDPQKFAVMKKGNKRALKLFDSQGSATQFISLHKDKKKLYIDIRESIPRRCENYCIVNKFCNFYQNYSKMKDKLKMA
ncbi:MAG: hypothetical protein P9L97_09145 [Candidatus Tenebribacter davisii]|nr:hypothetical protein [Candidatus Tenebribacter davisii]